MNHRKILKIWWLALLCGFIFSCMAKPLFAQDPAETRKWIGGGDAFGTYGQSDVEESEDLEGITLEIMLSHRIFDDSMALGKAFMDTRFEHGFEDTTEIITRSTLGFSWILFIWFLGRLLNRWIVSKLGLQQI